MSDNVLDIGTWTIIHSDGQTTTVVTERTGDGKSDPEFIEEGEMQVVAFGWRDGTVRIFPLATIFEIKFVPEVLDE